MKYYAHIDTNGKILGWYNDEIHCTKTLDKNNNIVLDKSKIPTPNIEVTYEVWQEALRIKANCYENGKFIVKDWRTVEEIEDIRIQQIEAKCNQTIESVYPIYKQINITNLLIPYTEDDRDIMKAFIDSKRAICHKAIDDGTKPEDVDFSDES